jgi:sulfatase modifying factor 1
MRARTAIPFVAALFAAFAFTKSGALASTVTDPGVIIEVLDGTNALTWDAAVAGAADVEYSDSLSGWAKVSTNNSTGAFQHSVGGATRGFYRLRWTPSAPSPVPAMITVQGGTLPESSQLAGVAVSTFQIGKYEVTWDEWQEVRDWAVTNGYIDLAGVGAGSAGDHPVRRVNWYDVVKWMNAKSEKEGLVPVYQVNGVVYRTGDTAPTLQAEENGYRLPKDAEWEWAARGGALSQGYIYSGSDDVNAVAWYADNSSGSAVDLNDGRGTWPVGQKVANELGIYDMSGNVSEWCEEVVYHRGGSWINSSGLAAVADRRSSSRGPTLRVNSLGFRLARNTPE